MKWESEHDQAMTRSAVRRGALTVRFSVQRRANAQLGSISVVRLAVAPEGKAWARTPLRLANCATSGKLPPEATDRPAIGEGSIAEAACLRRMVR